VALNFVVFVIEATTYALPWSDIFFSLDFPLILILVTPTFSNEIVSFEIMIVPIENSFSYISNIKSSS
jgi:hypothetical protein